ncbi:MAG: hydrogenase maturation protease [Candidatus Edwardsbacteria bacterium]|jgi:hydrogenase 3 maturation protease|nr:hydrogenase maturation protease [Candidatus Edwardsbacteria bacterium]
MDGLREYLQSLGARSLIVGVGNALRGDDGFGPELAARLAGTARCPVLDGGEMPEDCGPQVLASRPDKLLFADAVAFGGAPGELVLLTPEQLGAKVAVTTHNLPLVMLLRQLRQQLPETDIRVLGVQPRQIDPGRGLSAEVTRTVELLGQLLQR